MVKHQKVSTYYENDCRLGQPLDLVAFPNNGPTYHPRSIVELAVVFGSQEVGCPSQADSVANGSQSSPGNGISRYKNKRSFTCPKLNTNTSFLSNITREAYNIKKLFRRKQIMSLSKFYLSFKL